MMGKVGRVPVVDLDGFGGAMLREWLVIESSMKHAVFADPEVANRKGGLRASTGGPDGR